MIQIPHVIVSLGLGRKKIWRDLQLECPATEQTSNSNHNNLYESLSAWFCRRQHLIRSVSVSLCLSQSLCLCLTLSLSLSPRSSHILKPRSASDHVAPWDSTDPRAPFCCQMEAEECEDLPLDSAERSTFRERVLS